MLKRIISTAVSAGIITAGLALPVSAAKYIMPLIGWEESFYNAPDEWTPESEWTEGLTGIELETDPSLVADGQGSVHLFCEKNLGNLYARAVQNVPALESGKTYRLSGKINASGTGWRYCIKLGNENVVQIDELTGSVTNEWMDFTYDFENTYSSRDLAIHLEAGGDIYADDISLKEVVSGEGETAELGGELLENGDFEAGFEAPADPAFVQAAPANGINYLSVKTELPVNIYMVTDSGEEKLELGGPVYSVSKYGLNVYQHSGLENGQNYRYIVKAVSLNGVESKGIEVSAAPSEIYDDYVKLTGWTYRNNAPNYGKVTIEPGIGIDGSAALQMSNMTDSSVSYGYLYFRNSTNFELEPGKIYKLSWWEKDGEHNTASSSMVIKSSNSLVSADGETYTSTVNSNMDITMTEIDGEWHQRTVYLNPQNASNTIEFQLNRHYESAIFDDFELYEVDDELEVVSGASNLMADSNCDFEADYAAPTDPVFVQAAPADSMNYINIKSDLPVNIYQITDSGAERLALGEPTLDNSTYKLKVYRHIGLTNGQDYTYVVKAINEAGIESPGVEVSATPSAIYSGYVELNGWTYRNNNNNYGKVTIEPGIGIDGSTALHASNMTDSNANSTYLYIKNENGFTLTPGKTYRLSFWEKDGIHNTLSNSMVIRINHSQVSADGGDTYADVNKNTDITMTETDGQWHQRILYLKAEEAENTLEIQLNRHYESMLLDNFELYEVNDDLEIVNGAENLMANSNGDFEGTSESGEIAVSYKYYPAYSDPEHFGDIMDPGGIPALSGLEDYDTDIIYAEASIINQQYREGKAFTLILAVYKDNSLYDLQMISGAASYGVKETQGFAYRVPDLDTGEYSVKMFLWDSIDSANPISVSSEIKEN